MTTTEELLTTMPSTTSLDITTISTPAGTSLRFTTQTTSTTTKEQKVATSSEETMELMTTMVSTTTQPNIDWEQMHSMNRKLKTIKDFIPILSSILDTLIAIGSTIVYGV